MDEKLVSCVITTYARASDMLRQCIDSVVAQTYRPIEIIVVDDNPASSPFKAEVAKLAGEYESLIYISHEVNQGAQKSRNDGIRASHGEFVAFLDDDDVWLPKKLETQIPLFAEKDVGLVYCRGYESGEDITDHKKPYSLYFRAECTHRSLLAFDDIGTTSQVVLRRECFDEVGYFDETLPARQDYEMWLRITTKYRAVGSAEFLFVRRLHDSGAHISRSRKKAQTAFLRIYEKYKADYKADRTLRALGFWQMGSHQVFEGTWFRFKYRMLAALTDPFVIWRRIKGREYVSI